MNMVKRNTIVDDDQQLVAPGARAWRRVRASPREALAPGFATVLDGLRARTACSGGARALVLASPEPSPAAGFVLDGLAARAEQLGMNVVRGELRGVPRRRLAPGGRVAPADRAPRHCFALTSRPDQVATEMDAWLSHHHDADLVLVEAPPLLDAIDGALVARACDGLVLVAEQGVTERRALREAAQRARGSGCTLLGVIVATSERPMPTWLERLAGGRAAYR